MKQRTGSSMGLWLMGLTVSVGMGIGFYIQGYGAIESFAIAYGLSLLVDIRMELGY